MISITSYLRMYQILLLLWYLEAFKDLYTVGSPRDDTILSHLKETLSYPRLSHPTVFEVHHTSPITEDKFYYDLSKINKKPPIYPKYGKLKSTLESQALKSCCGSDDDSEEVVLDGLGELFGPVSLPAFGNYGITEGKTDDEKPVTEIIEDDLKYDFRTKTHYL